MPIAPRGTARRRLGSAPESPPESAEPGPWVGTIERLVPGRALVAVRTLDLRDDPVAEHHTLGGRRVSALDPDRKGLPVVPFTVMAEMLAQAAAMLMPGLAVVGAPRRPGAHAGSATRRSRSRWSSGRDRDPARPDEVRVAIHNRGPGRPGATAPTGRPSRARSSRVASSSAPLARRGRSPPRSSWKGRAPAGSPPRSSTPTSGSSTALPCRRWSGWGHRRHGGSRGRCRSCPAGDCSARRTGPRCGPTRSCSTPSLTCWDAGGWTRCPKARGT